MQYAKRLVSCHRAENRWLNAVGALTAGSADGVAIDWCGLFLREVGLNALSGRYQAALA